VGDAKAVASVFTRATAAAARVYVSFVWWLLLVVREATRTSLGMALPHLRPATMPPRGPNPDPRHAGSRHGLTTT
jgi:hypothetical protein